MGSSDYKIEKLEKGPLQRFKNQNLLLKKFGETGLQVYKVMTGRRTAAELRKDLDIEDDKFNQILKYMEEAGMVKLVPLGAGGAEAAPEEETAPETPPEPEEEAPARKPKKQAPEEEEAPPEEESAPEIKPEEEIAPEITPEEEAPPARKKKPAVEEEIVPEEIQPEEIKPEEEAAPEEEPQPARKKKPAEEEEIVPEEITPEEIKPEEEIAPEEEEAPRARKRPAAGEAAPEEPAGEEEAKEEKLAPEEISFGGEEAPEKAAEGEEESPVEKIIRDKYGDIGVQVYTLIDGQRTAEEIMDETGLSEAKLVEILDFLDEQGIIKLEYPKGKPEAAAAVAEKTPEAAEEFAPMIEGEEDAEKAAVKDTSPVLLPAKAPVAITKSVQMRAKTMLRYGDAGDKMLAATDGKKDVIDIALQLNLPLPKVMEMLNFVRDEGGITMAPVDRQEVRKKYGEVGFSVYKRYGKEGLMLYELVGKDMTIKEMADRVTTEKAKVVDMFLFIYEVLGIEMPINKETLMKQLGI
jgi:transcription initiation factor IIE alpha subunit